MTSQQLDGIIDKTQAYFFIEGHDRLRMKLNCA